MNSDVLLIGGGLQSSLIALALRAAQPTTRVTMVERTGLVGGNHVWSFHASDVPADARPWVDPLVAHRWPAHEVEFPRRRRRLDGAYASIPSWRLHEAMTAWAEHPGAQLRCHRRAVRVGRHQAELDDGSVLSASLVIDARGPDHFRETPLGYQKFVGLSLALAAPAPRDVPLLMDARVPQTDGFRFFYVLPFEPRRVLIEDTYFADGPSLDRDRVRAEVLAYAARRGYRVDRVEREEWGVLPLPGFVGRGEAGEEESHDGPLRAGYGGGWFHPTTGYSLPAAVRLARCLAPLSPEHARQSGALEAHRRHHRRQARYAARLTRLLFRAFSPQDRWHVLSRFYGLPEETIRRFYALETTPWDRARILCGRPPRGFSITGALRLEENP